MQKNKKIKQIFDIKNGTCYYFDDIININDLNLDILLVEKSYDNILIYDISYKSPYREKYH